MSTYTLENILRRLTGCSILKNLKVGLMVSRKIHYGLVASVCVPGTFSRGAIQEECLLIKLRGDRQIYSRVSELLVILLWLESFTDKRIGRTSLSIPLQCLRWTKESVYRMSIMTTAMRRCKTFLWLFPES